MFAITWRLDKKIYSFLGCALLFFSFFTHDALAFENNFAEYNKGMYSDIEQKSYNRRKVTAVNRAKLQAHLAKKGAGKATSSVIENNSSGPVGGVVVEGDNHGDIIIINDIKGDVTSIGK
ncbi:hypothetical protein [Maridesulfovibrio zosterae]|uniref:hypothetical protein n=1 Tax=Maridesulfovibrio zosterae TaxID=82171 RepID=UPI000412B7BF|nr:hypothetical protein [Maridesulfovibrio zosterae]